MFRRLTLNPALAAVVAAGLLLSAVPAHAQPEKKVPPGFEKKIEKRFEGDKKPEPGNPADAVRMLEAELERAKAVEAQIQEKLRALREGMKGGPPFGPGFGRPGGFGPGSGLPVERMSAEQIKDLIGHLQKALEEKTRGDKGEKPVVKPGEKPGTKPEVKPETKPGEKGKKPVSQDEILERLEKLSREIDEIRKSLKK